MPNGTTEAESYATTYWQNNNDFIQRHGENVDFDVTFPDGNRAVKVEATADVPTWFLRFVGVDKWHVGASGRAESQVLDIAVILDTSGSMCFDTFIQSESTNTILMSPGPAAKLPKLKKAIPAGGGDEITIELDDVSIFNSTSSSANNANFGYNSTTRYYQRSIASRTGIIAIHSNTGGTGSYELFDIQSINSAENKMTVRRAQKNNFTGASTSKIAHPVDAEVWANRNGCDVAARNGADGPFLPYDPTINAAQYFVGLFNSTYDQIGVGYYSWNGSKTLDLSSDLSTVKSRIDAVAFPDGNTNIAHGLATGRKIVNGTNSRPNSIKIVVLLTDGIANQYCSSSTFDWNNYKDGCSSNSNNVSTGVSHAKKVADLIGGDGTIIYTIGLGHDVDGTFLADIATRGKGKYYASPTTAQLDEAFRKIAEETHIALTQ
jgi:Mg-chelatase subunit ChlD